jgi:hypothetical protein
MILTFGTVLITPVFAHSGDIIESSVAVIVPTIDGEISPGEWDDAAFFDISNKEGLGGHPDNICYLYIKNDETYLYVAFDIVSDPDLDGPPPDDPYMAGEHVSIWIDGDHSGDYPETPQNDVTYRLFAYVPDDYQPYHKGPSFDASRVYRPDPEEEVLYHEPLPTTGTGQANNTTGHAQYELKIPFAEFEYQLGTTVGIFIFTYNLEYSIHIGQFPSEHSVWTYAFHPEYWADFASEPYLAKVEVTWQMIDEPDNRITPGDLVKYRITVNNIGTIDLTNVIVTLTSPNDRIWIAPWDEVYESSKKQNYGNILVGESESSIWMIYIKVTDLHPLRPGVLFPQEDLSWVDDPVITGNYKLKVKVQSESYVLFTSEISIEVQHPDFSYDYTIEQRERYEEFLLGSMGNPDEWMADFGFPVNTYHPDDELIRNVAAKAIAVPYAADTPYKAAYHIFRWIVLYYLPLTEEEPGFGRGWSDKEIIEKMMKGRSGVCTQFADLAISLSRSIGIPARFIIADFADPYKDHGWAEVYVKAPRVEWVWPIWWREEGYTWVQLDAAMYLFDDPLGYWRSGIEVNNAWYCKYRDCWSSWSWSWMSIPFLGTIHVPHWDDANLNPNPYNPRELSPPQHVFLSLSGTISTGETKTEVYHYRYPLEVRVNLGWLGSDLDLHLYDPYGRHVGMNYTTGQVEVGIPNAIYFGPSAVFELIIAKVPIPGEWKLVICGVNASETPYMVTLSTTQPPPIVLPTVKVAKMFEQSVIHTGREGTVVVATNATVVTGTNIVNFNFTDTLPQSWFIRNLKSVSVLIYDAKGHVLEVSRQDMAVSFQEGKLNVFINFSEGVTVTAENGTEYVIYTLKYGETIQIKYPMFPTETLVLTVYETKTNIVVTSLEGGSMTAITFVKLKVEEKPRR